VASDNPFDVPGTSNEPATTGTSASRPVDQARFTDLMEQYLLRARPWQMFLGVIGFLAAGLLALGGIFVVLAGLIAVASGGRPEQALIGVMGIAYFLIAALYAYPAWCLFQAGSNASRLVSAYDAEDRELAGEAVLRHVQNFFRFTGIMTAIVLGLYVLLLLLMCMGAMGGAMMTPRF